MARCKKGRGLAPDAWVFVTALGFMAMPTPVLADDPNDPTMRSAAAKAKDRALTRELNLGQLRHVQQRDAGYAQGWQSYREYPERRADYERQMAEWRRAVKLCQGGRREYCAR